MIKDKKASTKYLKDSKKGITLVALVVTIIVLLILAGVTITVLMGDDGIIRKAQEAGEATNAATENEIQGINDLSSKINNVLDDTGIDTDETIAGINTVTTTNHETLKAKDNYGNIVTVPEGFKVVEGKAGEEISVQNGVVIEDSAGNQFVWIPVGIVIKNDGSKSNEIKLGRYTFDSNGTPTEQQLAYTTENSTNYLNTVPIESWFQELSISRDGVESLEIGVGENATAKDLAGFVQSVKNNGGYYIARYEASYGSGNSISDYKPLSKISTGTPRETEETPLTTGMLWNFITQVESAHAARNMYLDNKDINGNKVGVESDLVNSYAWDTAIVYIQEMGNTNYANTNCDRTGNKDLMNTGTTGDVACNIYDMAANVKEWSTEFSSYKNENYPYPCVRKGGVYDNNENYPYTRTYGVSTNAYIFTSFRPIIYIK